jgi:hypothetical protein
MRRENGVVFVVEEKHTMKAGRFGLVEIGVADDNLG